MFVQSTFHLNGFSLPLSLSLSLSLFLSLSKNGYKKLFPSRIESMKVLQYTLCNSCNAFLAYQYCHASIFVYAFLRRHIDMCVHKIHTLRERLFHGMRFPLKSTFPSRCQNRVWESSLKWTSPTHRCPSLKGWSGKPGERTAYESIQQWSYAAVRELGTAQNAKSPSSPCTSPTFPTILRSANDGPPA